MQDYDHGESSVLLPLFGSKRRCEDMCAGVSCVCVVSVGLCLLYEGSLLVR